MPQDDGATKAPQPRADHSFQPTDRGRPCPAPAWPGLTSMTAQSRGSAGRGVQGDTSGIRAIVAGMRREIDRTVRRVRQTRPGSEVALKSCLAGDNLQAMLIKEKWCAWGTRGCAWGKPIRRAKKSSPSERSAPAGAARLGESQCHVDTRQFTTSTATGRS
jgi:hypothetical protein